MEMHHAIDQRKSNNFLEFNFPSWFEFVKDEFDSPLRTRKVAVLRTVDVTYLTGANKIEQLVIPDHMPSQASAPRVIPFWFHLLLI
jgi:hypothetical protein